MPDTTLLSVGEFPENYLLGQAQQGSETFSEQGQSALSRAQDYFVESCGGGVPSVTCGIGYAGTTALYETFAADPLQAVDSALAG